MNFKTDKFSCFSSSFIKLIRAAPRMYVASCNQDGSTLGHENFIVKYLASYIAM